MEALFEMAQRIGPTCDEHDNIVINHYKTLLEQHSKVTTQLPTSQSTKAYRECLVFLIELFKNKYHEFNPLMDLTHLEIDRSTIYNQATSMDHTPLLDLVFVMQMYNTKLQFSVDDSAKK